MSAAAKKAIRAHAAARSAVDEMKRELDDLARRREELVEKREVIEAAPVDRATAEKRIGDLIEALAAQADVPAGALAHPDGYREVVRELTALPVAAGPSPWGLLAAVAPDLLAEAMRRRLAETYDRLPAPLSAEERREALAEVDRELAGVERELASLWWSALDADIQLPVPDVSGTALAGLKPAAV